MYTVWCNTEQWQLWKESGVFFFPLTLLLLKINSKFSCTLWYVGGRGGNAHTASCSEHGQRVWVLYEGSVANLSFSEHLKKEQDSRLQTQQKKKRQTFPPCLSLCVFCVFTYACVCPCVCMCYVCIYMSVCVLVNTFPCLSTFKLTI